MKTNDENFKQIVKTHLKCLESEIKTLRFFQKLLITWVMIRSACDIVMTFLKD